MRPVALTLLTTILAGTPIACGSAEPGEVKSLNSMTFEEYTSEGNVVVDFTANWCGPCRKLEPAYEAVAKRNPKIKFGKVNVKLHPFMARNAGVEGLPHVVFYENGIPVETMVGIPASGRQETIERRLENYLSRSYE